MIMAGLDCTAGSIVKDIWKNTFTKVEVHQNRDTTADAAPMTDNTTSFPTQSYVGLHGLSSSHVSRWQGFCGSTLTHVCIVPLVNFSFPPWVWYCSSTHSLAAVNTFGCNIWCGIWKRKLRAALSTVRKLMTLTYIRSYSWQVQYT